jgi:hypothetical protein
MIFRSSNEPPYSGFATDQVETEHGAESALLATGNGVPGMICQARKIHAFDRMMGQKLIDQSQGVGLLNTQAVRSGCAIRAGQPGIEGTAGHPDTVGPPGQLVCQILVAGDTAPPTTSLCPLMYLVVECTTMSAPSASGCCSAGDRKVLSATNSVLPRSIPSATRAISVTLSNGLLGVSSQTMRAFSSAGPPAGSHPENPPIPGKISLGGQCVEQTEGSAIAIQRSNQPVARLEQLQHGRDRAHAGCRDGCAATAFQLGQRIGQQIPGRIA